MPRPVGEDGQSYGIEMIQPNMAGAETLKGLLMEYWGDQIMRYVLGQTITNKPQAGGFGSDLPQIQLGSYLQIIKYDAINLGETMTTDIVTPLKEFNYPQFAEIPVRFVVDTESEDMEAKLAAWKQAYDVGVKTKASDWLKMIGASKPEEDDEVIQNPVTMQQDRLYQQWLEHQQQAAAMGMSPQGQPQPGEQPGEEPGGSQVQGGLGDDMEESAGDAGPMDELAGDEGQEPYAKQDAPPSENSERQSLAKYSLAEEIEHAAAETDTTPSEAEKKAGNYRKGKVRIRGLEVAIENPKGSIRSGNDSSGTPWSVEMANHYGYIKTHISEADGDHVDCFIGPQPDSEIVFVVNQTKAPAWKQFDEHKVMIGFTSSEKAKRAYLANFSEGWQGFDSIVPMTMDQFKEWLEHGDTGVRVVEKYAKAFDHGQIHQQLMERYYRQSPAAEIEDFWAGNPGTITVIQDGKPLRYSRGRRGSVTIEDLAAAT